MREWSWPRPIKCLHGSPVGREERETLVYMPKARPRSFDLRQIGSILMFFVHFFILFTVVMCSTVGSVNIFSVEVINP